nr:putative ribonuclease H-like domain-containing protein [Tanacetum cinerariifolium]
GLEYISFDDMYNKLKFLEIDIKGYSSSSSTLSNASFVSTAGSSQGNTEPRSLENFGMIDGIKIESDADSEGEVVSADNVIPVGVFISAGNVAAAVVSPQFKTEFALMGLSTEVSIPVTYPLCCDSKYKLIEKDYQGQREQLNDCVVDLKAHKNAVKTLEKQIKCHQKNQLAYEEKIRVLSYTLEEKSNILEYRQKLIDQAAQEKQELTTKLDNEIANQAKWNNSGKSLYKLNDSSMSVRTKRGLGLDKYIREGELGIDDSQFSIFHTNSNDLEGQPIYNRFASVDHMKAVPPSLTGNYMPPSNIPDIDESQMVYGKKAIDSSKINDRSSEPSTNDLQTCDSSVECSRPNHSDHDSTDYISSVSAPASESGDTIVIDCDKQEDFPSICSIETDVKSSKPLCNKFGPFNKESHFRKHKFVASKSCYVCGSYFYLIKDCDLHEQRFTKRNAEWKGKLGRRPTGKQVNPNRPKPVFAVQPNPISAGQPNPVSAGQPNPVSAGHPNPISAGDGILGPRPLNIQTKSKYFHSFTYNNRQIIFLITHNSLYSLYMTGGLNGNTDVKPLAGWPWTQYGMSKTKGFKINGGTKFKSWSYAKCPLGRPKLEKAKDRGIVDSGCSRSMSGNKDKLEDFKYFDGGEVTFGGRTVQAWMFDIDYLTDSLNYSRVSNTNLSAGSQGATPSNASSHKDDSDSDDEPDVLIIHFTSTLVVPIFDEATTQNDGIKSDHATTNTDNLGKLTELQALQRQEQAGKEEANQLGLAFPSLNLILGVGSTPLVLLPVSVGRPVSAGKSTGSACRPVSTGRPSGFAARAPIPTGRILGKLPSNTPSERFPRASSVENSDIHDGLKIFDCLKSGIFTSSSYDEEFSSPDANNLASSVDVSSTITKRIHNIHPTSQILGDINSPVQTRSQVKHKGSSDNSFISYIYDQRRNNRLDFQLCMFSYFLSQEEPTTVAQALADPDWVEAMQA